MEQTVRVHRCFHDGTAQVLRVRESACSGECHKCSGCGAAKQTMIFTADNPIGAKPGDVVVVQSDSASVLKGAAMLYILPLLLFFAGYFAGDMWFQQGALFGGVAFAAGIACSCVYDRVIVQKQKTVYTIVSYSHTTSNLQEKGDN